MYHIKRILRNYEAFQTIVLGSVFLMLVCAVVTRGRGQASRAFGNEAVWLLLQYCTTYWVTHWRLAAAFIAALALTLGFYVLRRPFHAMFKTPLFPITERPRYVANLEALNRFLKIGLCALIALHVPLVHLRVGTWAPIALYLGIPIPVVLFYVFLYEGELRIPRTRRALARHTFPTKSWNVAGVAHVSLESQREAQLYARVPETWEYTLTAAGALDSLWRGHVAFGSRLAHFLGVQASELRLFGNTTDAIEHALRECAASLGKRARARHILTTDVEYPSVSAKIDELATRYNAAVRRVAIRGRIYGGADDSSVLQELLAAVDPDVSVLCLSHVAFETGFRLPLLPLLNAMLPKGCKAFVVVDGAQAVGHVELEAGLLARVHYYATSGHKWLLGGETLGILFSNASNALTPQIKRRLPLAASLSTFSTLDDHRKESKATIAAAPRLTLNGSLADITAHTMRAIAAHNVALARRLSEMLEVLPGCHLIPIRSDSGICVMEIADVDAVAERLRRSGFIIGVQPERDGLPSFLRICCHYYHSARDVENLVYGIADAVVSQPVARQAM